MKSRLLVLALLCAGSLLAQTNTIPATRPVDFKSDPAALEYAKQAGSAAIREWMRDFIAKRVEPKTYAVLPFTGDIDSGYYTGTASTEFANVALGTPYSLYTASSDPVLEALNKEMMLATEDREDIYNQATIQKFSRVNVQGLIIGRVTGIYYAEQPSQSAVQVEGFEKKAIQVRITLTAYENATGRILWGGEKTAAVVMPGNAIVVKQSWIVQALLYGGGGLGVLFLLFILHRIFLAANRPR